MWHRSLAPVSVLAFASEHTLHRVKLQAAFLPQPPSPSSSVSRRKHSRESRIDLCVSAPFSRFNALPRCLWNLPRWRSVLCPVRGSPFPLVFLWGFVLDVCAERVLGGFGGVFPCDRCVHRSVCSRRSPHCIYSPLLDPWHFFRFFCFYGCCREPLVYTCSRACAQWWRPRPEGATCLQFH